MKKRTLIIIIAAVLIWLLLLTWVSACMSATAADGNHNITVVNADRSIEPLEIEGFCEFFNMRLTTVWYGAENEYAEIKPEQAVMTGFNIVHGELIHDNGIFMLIIHDEYLSRIPMFDVGRENTNTFLMLVGYESAPLWLGYHLFNFHLAFENHRVFGSFRIREMNIFNDADITDAVGGSFQQVWQIPRS